jgi:16S rRNA G1207 methylase RsmC
MPSLFIKTITRILSTNLFAKLLFGVDCSKSKIKYQIGFSTILMKKALKKYIKNGYKVLDMGTGPVAIHGIWIKKNFDVDLVSTEIDDAYVDNAKRIMENNNVRFDIIKNDLFKGLEKDFDWVIFNPPFRNREDREGYKLFSRFLKEASKNLRLMVVVNAAYVNQKKIESIIKNRDYSINYIVTAFLNPSKVYIIKRN